jgi:(p)ppGpp synthase/HD superfamily hydrolase
MINLTERLDKAIRVAAWAHEQDAQRRKGTDIPYIIHPFGVMLVAATATDDEDVLIACLLHDVLEDVAADIYSEAEMRADFGDRVVAIVQDVTKDETKRKWHDQSEAYLNHLEHEAGDEAVIVSASDKIHNLTATLTDHDTHGDELWERFSTKSSADQLWWYSSILAVVSKRGVPRPLREQLTELVGRLQVTLAA